MSCVLVITVDPAIMSVCGATCLPKSSNADAPESTAVLNAASAPVSVLVNDTPEYKLVINQLLVVCT